ncbi:MAG TPA: hypothetical protein VGN90_05625 [Pyrinomonadaceae bacterium]|jgi:hypothetical protein|nr:hypothetical protein [Pyrinomonadaceae bacterium]
MPARKAGKKTAAKKGASKSPKAEKASLQITTAILKAKIARREWVMYAQPIRDVTAQGNIATMRSAAVMARTHLADVTKSLAQLDAAIRARGK